jgi:hypothetical protein
VKVKNQCKGHSSKTGERCRSSAMHGQLVCWSHGGANPKARAAATVRVLSLKTIEDAEPMANIGEVYNELLAIAGITRQWRKILTERVAQLEELDQWGGDAGRQIKVDVIVFERALERSAKIAEMIVRLNLEERKQALDEQLAGQVAAVVRAILLDLELTPEQERQAAIVAPARLRELTA